MSRPDVSIQSIKESDASRHDFECLQDHLIDGVVDIVTIELGLRQGYGAFL